MEETEDEFSSIREHVLAEQALTSEEVDKLADLAIAYLKDILSLFSEESYSIDEYDGDNGELILDIKGDGLAILIGRHGCTLEALQTVLTSLMSSKTKFFYPIVVDIESYKSRRKKKIQDMAHNAAERAVRHHATVSLAPMSSYERRLVHLSLVNDERVKTYSKGDDPERYVVVVPA